MAAVEKPTATMAPPQEGDWPPGYVPGEGFTNAQETAPPPTNDAFYAPPNGAPPSSAPNGNDANINNGDVDGFPSANGAAAGNKTTPVPLKALKPRPQYIDCPNCKIIAQTQIQGRSEGKQKFMNVFWWPLPGRKHWWEKMYWYCSNCKVELAMQKNGKPLEITYKAGQGAQ